MRASRFAALGIVAGALVTSAGCSHDWDLLDPRLEGGTGAATSAASGSGGSTSSGTVGTSSTGTGIGGAGGQGSSSAASGGGGAGGATPALVEDGLPVRYYLDEAASGQGPTHALDAAPAPLDLPLTYTAGMSYAEIDGHRGLSWDAIELDGRASAPIAGTKIEAELEGLAAATIESVVKIDAVSPSNSRISHIGTGSESGRFTLSTGDTTSLNFFWRPGGDAQMNAPLAGLFPVSFTSLGRVVLHLVLDVAQPAAQDRVRLYVDGAPVAAVMSTPPAPGEAIALGADNHFVLGNREIGVRSFVGQLYYSAMYTRALGVAEVQNNAAVLLSSDDSPP